MTFRKSTHYALHAVLEMARSGRDVQVTVTQVAERYGIRTSVLAKVFQQLVHAGIAVGTRGSRGGYALARDPSELTVLDVIDAFETTRQAEQCALNDDEDVPCPELASCRLRRLFDEVDETARATYASVTFETLVGDKSNRVLSVRVVR
jgi:Rrf2 family protein